MNLKKILRGFTHNHAALDDDDDDRSLHPPILSTTISDVADRIESWTATTRSWSTQSRRERDAVVTMHLTHATRVFRFVDDIHVTLTDVKGKTRVDATSRSRIGKGDLGQNARNLKQLVAALR